jgi:hypothetical protein
MGFLFASFAQSSGITLLFGVGNWAIRWHKKAPSEEEA